MITRLWAITATMLLGLVLVAVPSDAQTGSVPTQPAGKVLIMGSSTTGCAGPSAADKCYVNIVKAASQTPQRHLDFTVLGRGGTHIGWGPASGNWTQTAIPGGHQTVVIQLGVNDWYTPVDPATLDTQVAELLGRVRAANPGARIIWLRTWMPGIPEADFTVRQAMWRNQGVTTRAAVKAVGGTWIEVDPYGDGGTLFRADATGWHYNDAGHARLAKEVLAAL
jgi:hypothetical protein